MKEGELVRWMLPLDNDYSYGKIEKVNKNTALIIYTTGYSIGIHTEVHFRYIKEGGGRSGNKTKRRT